MCMCVAAIRAIVIRYTAQNVMQTCMLPRELIWDRVAPSHTGVTLFCNGGGFLSVKECFQ